MTCLTLLAAACSSSANPFQPGEVDLAVVPGFCISGISGGVYGDNCTYVGRDANSDSVPDAVVQWEVRPGIVPLTTTRLDQAGRVRILFSAPATPGDSLQLWMCASTLPPPCRLIDYGGTVHFP